MAELKTKPNTASVDAFLHAVDDEQRRDDCLELVRVMKRVTKKPPKMWGDSIVGFGNYRYKYDSGREGEWFLTGFSPRKKDLTLYIMSGFKRYGSLMTQLGKHSTGKSCLYIKRLSDVDTGVLEELIRESVEHLVTKYA